MRKKDKAILTGDVGECDEKGGFSVFLQRVIKACFILPLSIVLVVLLCFSWVPHCIDKGLLLPNIVLLITMLAIGWAVFRIFRKVNILEEYFLIIIATVFAVIFIVQICILAFGYFYTDWDAGLVNSLADWAIESGGLEDNGYLSLYPNNIVLIAILVFIKSVSFFGSHYLFLLAINALLVNLAGFFTCLSIKELISKKSALLSTFLIIPLLVLSPWIMIPYSDTFAVLIPILIFYIYLKNKRWWKYAIITFLGVFGYFIKPTVIIMLVAVLFIELVKHKNIINKVTVKYMLGVVGAVCLAFLMRFAAMEYIGFRQNDSVRPISFVHYLAMGQNEERCGMYLQKDVDESRLGLRYELNKFYDRINSRSFGEQVKFFTEKTLINFDDGTFAWAREGTLFYAQVPERDSDVSDTITNYYYSTGDNYAIFNNTRQALWLFVLFGCVFVFCFRNGKQKIKAELIMGLALFGVMVFVTIFEARSRYLFCYVPIFITCAAVGYSNLRERLEYCRCQKRLV